MGEKWRANVAYGPAGTRVEYQGTVYELIQPHTSQIGWEPSAVPALWRVARDQNSGHHSSSSHHSSSHHSSSHHHHSHSHSSSSSDDDHHHHSSSHHSKPQQSQPQQSQPQQTQPQFQQQPQQNIVNATQQQPSGPKYQWVKYTGGPLPQNCIKETTKIGKTFVVARARVQDGSVHPGYVDPAKGNYGRIYLGYGGKEIVSEDFEILVAEPGSYQWVPCFNPKDIVGTTIEGGHEKDNTPLYVTKCDQAGVTYFGKTSSKASCAYYSYNTKEIKINQFHVLCLK